MSSARAEAPLVQHELSAYDTESPALKSGHGVIQVAVEGEAPLAFGLPYSKLKPSVGLDLTVFDYAITRTLVLRIASACKRPRDHSRALLKY